MQILLSLEIVKIQNLFINIVTGNIKIISDSRIRKIDLKVRNIDSLPTLILTNVERRLHLH